MNKGKKLLILLLSICLLVPAYSERVWAASASVKVTSASGKVGSTVSVTCTASASGASIGGADVVLVYDASKLSLTGCTSGASGGSGSVYASLYAASDGQKSLSFTMSFKILKEGKHNVSVSSASVFDFDANDLTASKSGGAITGKAETTPTQPDKPTQPEQPTTPDKPEEPTQPKDKNSKLKSLQVYPGTLSPAFQANTTSYTVTVPKDTKSVTISAAAQSSKAKFYTSGGKDLKPGPNSAKVVVTAEDGSTTVYNLKIMCGELETITIDGKSYTIEEGFADKDIPKGFAREKLTYKEQQYEGLSHQKGDLKLLCLKNSSEGKSFYIYKTQEQSFYNFVFMEFAEGKSIIPIPLGTTETFAGVEEVPITLQNKTINSWKVDEEFRVFRAMNQDGEEVFYRYDSVDGTVQRHADLVIEAEPIPEEVPETEQPQNNPLAGYEWYVIMGLAGVCVLLLIILIVVLASRNHKHTARRKKIKKKLKSQKNNE